MDDKIKEKITKKAFSLEKCGVNDLVWNKEDAQNLINSILKDKIGILGGDVYKINSHRLEPLYDNWSSEKKEFESQEEYYLRSKIESLSFIKGYPIYPDEKIVFSITFTEQVI